MLTRLRYVLVALVLLVSQTLAICTANAHDSDPGHIGDDCSICLMVQAGDVPGPVPAERAELPLVLFGDPAPIASECTVTALLLSSVRARAPPL